MMHAALLAVLLSAPPALAPVITPAAGTYSGPQTVTARALSSGSIIRCCTAPGCSVTLYSDRYLAPLVVTSDTTVKCRAWVKDKAPSSTASVAYVITPLPSGTPQALYAAASAACSAMPLRMTGTKRYFCDCQTGAQSGCVAGNDSADGLSPANAKRTWPSALSAFNAMNAGDTVALCRGGAWSVVPTNGVCSNEITNPRCSAGASLSDPDNLSTCDLRDYPATCGGASCTEKPVLATTTASASIVTRQNGSTNGVRILNITFRGSNLGPRGGVYNQQFGFLSGCGGGVTDSGWLVCNSTFERFRVGWQTNCGNSHSNIQIRGSLFSMDDLDGILGFGNGTGITIDANVFDNVAGQIIHPVLGNAGHNVYLSPLCTVGSPQAIASVGSNVAVTNNQFIRTLAGNSAVGICQSPPLVSHGQFQTVNIENNLLDSGPTSGSRCWGISFNRGGDSDWTYFRNMTVRRNAVLNVTGEAITIGQAPGVIIENNVAAFTPTTTWNSGIVAPYQAARAGQDDVQNGTVIRNNTVYMPLGGTGNGLVVGAEGTGHVIANNVIYKQTGQCIWTSLGHCSVTTSQQCDAERDFDAQGAGLPLCPGGETCIEDATAYAFVGNNACFGGVTHTDHTPDGVSVITNPLFTLPPTDFTPQAGSPLINAGSSTYGSTTDYLNNSRSTPPDIGAVERP
jgi:hypothetical protein